MQHAIVRVAPDANFCSSVLDMSDWTQHNSWIWIKHPIGFFGTAQAKNIPRMTKNCNQKMVIRPECKKKK